MHGVQIPLDAADGQPPLFPQRGDQAEQVDAEALLAQDHAAQLGWGQKRRRHPGQIRAMPKLTAWRGGFTILVTIRPCGLTLALAA